jgi:CDP-diacylglycerol---serine O-phosphatidyltransferase
VTAPHDRTGVRRAIIILPGAFTTGNLFFGIWSIVEAARGEFERAAWFIVIAGVLDALDGRVARLTRTGSDFGAELDSLADVISFGVAPALLQWHFQFSRGEWGWLIPFIFILGVALRLARFNVEQAGHAKTQFYGLPSPAAGATVATLVPFMGTPYFAEHLSHLPWHLLTAMLMVMIALLMVSHVPYPVAPRVGLRTWNGRFGLGLLLTIVWGAAYVPGYFFFPLAIAFITFGLLRALYYGYLDRLPEDSPLREEFGESDVLESGPAPRQRFRNPLRRRPTGPRREEH